MFVDPDGNSGIHFQLSAQSTTFIMRGQISGGFAVDHNGNVAITTTVGGGPAIGVGASVSASATLYPAPSFTVDQLQGNSNSVGAYITAPGMGGRASIQGVNISSDFDLSTIGGTVGLESGAGLGVFWSIDQTGVYEVGNLADGSEAILERLNEITDTLSPEHRDLINQSFQLFKENENELMETLNE